MSWSCWQNRFHADPGVLGKNITLQGHPTAIIGVTPRAFTGLRVEAQTDVWQPLPERADINLVMLARLKPAATRAQARAEMPVLYRFTIEERSARSTDPQTRKLKVELEPAGAGLSTLRDRIGKPLLVLMALAALLVPGLLPSAAPLVIGRWWFFWERSPLPTRRRAGRRMWIRWKRCGMSDPPSPMRRVLIHR